MVYYTRHGVETVVDNAGGNRAVVNFCGRSLYWASILSGKDILFSEPQYFSQFLVSLSLRFIYLLRIRNLSKVFQS